MRHPLTADLAGVLAVPVCQERVAASRRSSSRAGALLPMIRQALIRAWCIGWGAGPQARVRPSLEV
jgi:hypothetical protein